MGQRGKNTKRPERVVYKIRKDTGHDIIMYALTTEKAARCIEQFNTLVLSVRKDASKPEIKNAVKELYGRAVKKVNTLINKHGKKAYVRFFDEGAALDIATQIRAI